MPTIGADHGGKSTRTYTHDPLTRADGKPDPLFCFGFKQRQIIGSLLYYARAIDCGLLHPLGTLSSQQAQPTEATMDMIVHLLNYCACHHDATINYRCCDMILYIESNASYLSEPKSKSRAAGYFYLSDNTQRRRTANERGPLHVLCNIIKEVIASAAEAELGGLFYNGKDAIPIIYTLEALKHPQPSYRMLLQNSPLTEFCKRRFFYRIL